MTASLKLALILHPPVLSSPNIPLSVTDSTGPPGPHMCLLGGHHEWERVVNAGVAAPPSCFIFAYWELILTRRDEA